jgi:NhaP-type Na+/H+ or K+/H+ antiporter
LGKKWKSLAILLGPVMLSMWLTSTFIIYALFPSQFGFLEAMTLAACITPTDPILASSIVKGRFAEEHIPEHVRDLLSAERYIHTHDISDTFVYLYFGKWR